MSLPRTSPREQRFDQDKFDDHASQIGQLCLYIPVLRCSCVGGFDRDPDPYCDLCDGTGFAEISYADLPEFTYKEVLIKGGFFPECLTHIVGLELLTPARIQIDGLFAVVGETTTAGGAGVFSGKNAGIVDYFPIKKGSLVVTSSTGKIAEDDGQGGFRGGIDEAGTNTIDYDTGAFTCTFDDGALSVSATADYTGNRTFVYQTDFNLIENPDDDKGARCIDWTGAEPINNTEYTVTYTMKDESFSLIQANIFKLNLDKWEAGTWQDGDVRMTPAATILDVSSSECFERKKNLIYDIAINDYAVLWNSRGVSVEFIDVPDTNILDLKFRFLVETIRVHRVNDAQTGIDIITPVSVDQIKGEVVIPPGNEGETVTVKYTYRPMYQAFYDSPQVRAHESGKSLPKHIMMRPVDLLNRDDKIEVT